MLGEFRQGVGGIDPVLDQAANYGKGMRAVQTVVREQGMVMSESLKNNEMLYHTNKQLKRELQIAQEALRHAHTYGERMERRAVAAEEYAAKLEAGGGDKFRPLYEQARQLLANHLHDAMTQEELAQKLSDMREQAKELAADPQALTLEQIQKLKLQEQPDERLLTDSLGE